MTCEDVAKKILQAIEQKDISALKQTLPESGPLASIMGDGSVLEEVSELIDFCEDWFADEEWNITHEVVFTEIATTMGFLVVDTEYFANDEDEPISVAMLTTLILRKVDDQWVLVHIQQTELSEEQE